MKKLWIAVTVALFVSVLNNVEAKAKIGSSAPSESFDWLIGNWVRSNEKADRQTYESWTKNSDTEYVGSALTVLHNDTIWQEKTKLYKSAEGWVLEVLLKDESAPTVFDVTSIAKNKFTCENEKNEFPKVILYQKKGSNLEAVLTGNGMKTVFEFKKK